MTPSYPQARTDRNKNPAALTTDVARQAGLREHVDYIQGDQFPGGALYWTAKLLGDPVALTIQVFDAIGFYTKMGQPRWSYIAVPAELWATFTHEQKVLTVAACYKREGGTEMKSLFA